jgi:predicted amidohydrolase
VEGKERLVKVANLFWKELWPGLQRELGRAGKAVVLGSVPCISAGVQASACQEDYSDRLKPAHQQFHNRVPILCDGRSLYQDKLHLTPWESVFAPGEALHLWSLRGVTFAVVICLDIEVPELSVALRGRGVDCLLVPSATESVLGVERVGRCASARAVELCCHVGVSQLVGRTESELVDENVGRLAWLNPSQSPFLSAGRETVSDLHDQGFHVTRCRLDALALAAARANRTETNPSLLTPKGEPCEIVLHESTNPTHP